LVASNGLLGVNLLKIGKNGQGVPAIVQTRLSPVFTVAFIGFFVLLIDGYDTLMLSFIAPMISKELSLTSRTIGEIFASSFAGAAIGAAIIGIAADRFGRKPMLLISLTLAGSFTLLCAWSQSPRQLMWFRALSGLGLGGAIPAITALTAAHTSPNRRSAVVTRMLLGYPLGAIVGGSITAAVMSIVGWRGVFMGGGLFALLLIPLVLLGLNEVAGSTQVVSGRPVRHPLIETLADGRYKTTVPFCVSVFCVFLTTYFLISWTPTVLVQNGMPPQQAALSAVVLNSGGVVGALAISFVVRRHPLLPIAICLLAGAALIALLGTGTVLSGIAVLPLIFAIGLLIIGAQLCVPGLCVHLFPPSISGTSVGLSASVGRVGSIIGPLIGGYLLAAQLGWHRLFALVALPSFGAGLAIIYLSTMRPKL
jgi:MFS transporter, AAHS family, 4-hydroxybenzoate transporter